MTTSADDVQKLSDDQVMHLMVRQSGIGLTAPGTRVLCDNRDDGQHLILGGALGTMIVSRRGYTCPICRAEVPVSEIPPESIATAGASEAITAPDAHMLIMAQERIAEYEAVVERDERAVLVHVACRFLERYVELANKALSKPKWPGPKIEAFPLGLLLALHNLAEPSSEGRRLVIEWLYNQRALNPRQHWLEAITVAENGDLAFDNDRYLHACWRGKQETYFNSARQAFEKMKYPLTNVSHFQGSEDEARENLAPATTLFEPRPLLKEVQALKAMAPELALIAEAIQDKGLPELARALQGAMTGAKLPGTPTQALDALVPGEDRLSEPRCEP